MKMTSKEIRKKFLNYFADKGHQVVPSASLIPDDPTLLLTVAGMVPFKPIFLGLQTSPYNRATSCQKCVRTNDIENVGKTARHQTFFEMLGNFSFGDYFKEEVIPWAWHFLTVELGLPKDKLWASVYTEDDEAYDIWHNKVGIPEERMIRLGEDDNFWAAGPVGPCGPCSEIYIDLGEARGCGSPDCKPGCDCDRFLEIWNLVFMQYSRDEAGVLTPLPKKNIDTGMGLERIASVLQDVPSNFETDLFVEIIDFTKKKAGLTGELTEEQSLALRIIADHLRATTFLINDGVIPGNEGRGYVLRRIMRRALRYAWLLHIPAGTFVKIMQVIIEQNKEAYPELKEREDYILRVGQAEDERFQATIGQGMDILNDMIAAAKKQQSAVLSGEQAFKLHDTYGFPLELTEEIAGEEGIAVDLDGFNAAMEEQRERARLAREDVRITSDMPLWEEIERETGKTQFIGYNELKTVSKVAAILVDGKRTLAVSEGEAEVFLNVTPFYGESGGQAGDLGSLTSSGVLAEVIDTKKLKNGLFSHSVMIKQGELRVGEEVTAEVNRETRLSSARNHSATHILHSALRQVLGQHVEQAGSMVTAERLRFDFAHFAPVTAEELEKIETLANQAVLASLPVTVEEVDLEQAKKQGAMALFGEKYGAKVRMVKMGDFSLELCGGTHLTNTAQIGCLKLLSETGIAAGVRRIEAVTGFNALKHIKETEKTLKEVSEKLKTVPNDLSGKVDKLLLTVKEQEKELHELKGKIARAEGESILQKAVEVDGIPVLAAEMSGLDPEALREMADNLRDKIQGVVVLGSVLGDKVIFVATVPKDLLSRGLHAGKIVKAAAAAAGGGGGGRPDMAQAGGKNPDKLPEALALVADTVKELLK